MSQTSVKTNPVEPPRLGEEFLEAICCLDSTCLATVLGILEARDFKTILESSLTNLFWSRKPFVKLVNEKTEVYRSRPSEELCLRILGHLSQAVGARLIGYASRDDLVSVSEDVIHRSYQLLAVQQGHIPTLDLTVLVDLHDDLFPRFDKAEHLISTFVSRLPREEQSVLNGSIFGSVIGRAMEPALAVGKDHPLVAAVTVAGVLTSEAVTYATRIRTIRDRITFFALAFAIAKARRSTNNRTEEVIGSALSFWATAHQAYQTAASALVAAEDNIRSLSESLSVLPNELEAAARRQSQSAQALDQARSALAEHCVNKLDEIIGGGWGAHLCGLGRELEESRHRLHEVSIKAPFPRRGVAGRLGDVFSLPGQWLNILRAKDAFAQKTAALVDGIQADWSRVANQLDRGAKDTVSALGSAAAGSNAAEEQRRDIGNQIARLVQEISAAELEKKELELRKRAATLDYLTFERSAAASRLDEAPAREVALTPGADAGSSAGASTIPTSLVATEPRHVAPEPGPTGTLASEISSLATRAHDAMGGPIQLDGAGLQSSDEPADSRARQSGLSKRAGALDPMFGTAGLSVTRFGHARAAAVGVSPDGAIIVAGSNGVDDASDFAVARFKRDGSLDSSFHGGFTTVDLSRLADHANAIVVQRDGKIVLAGDGFNVGPTSSSSDFALVRLTVDGSLDRSFGRDGLQFVDFQKNSYDMAAALLLQEDDKIVAGGHTVVIKNGHVRSGDFALARYLPDATLDASFGTSGLVITDFEGGFDRILALALQPDGQIVAGGSTTFSDGKASDFALARYTSDGVLDNSFGHGGRVTTDLGNTEDVAHAVIVQSDGKIVAAGYSATQTSKVAAMVRYLTDGTLDTTFGDSGRMITDFNGRAAAILALASDESGILAAGYLVRSDETATEDFLLARFTPDGTLDSGFGQSGVLTTDFGGLSDVASALALLPDGRLVLAGTTGTTSHSAFAVACYYR